MPKRTPITCSILTDAGQVPNYNKRGIVTGRQNIPAKRERASYMTNTSPIPATNNPIGFADPDDYARMRDVLTAANYNDESILKTVGQDAVSAQKDSYRLALHDKLKAMTPQESLILLFLVGKSMNIQAARAAVAPMPLEKWVEAGLITVTDNRAVSPIQLTPFCGVFMAYDRPLIAYDQAIEDYVMGVGSSTMTLANITVRRHVNKTLDLGSGCGTHAFLAACHSDQVFAVDRNPRATAFAQFNANLNGLANVHAVTGSLFEPVAEHRFGLVVSNPPFVISPSQRFIYRDGGLRGDEFCQQLARDVPAYLEEGGYCQFLCNWAHYKGQNWQERLAGWFEGTGCDVWVMRSETRDASTYATTWITHTESGSSDNLSDIYDQWMAYYDQEGIEQMSTGIVMMRKASGRTNWCKIGDSPKKMLGRCGDDIQLCFALRDYLESTRDDTTLLDAKLTVSPAVRMNQQFRPEDGSWVGGSPELCRTQGLAFNGNVDPYIAGLVARCNGQRTLRELIHELAQITKQDVDTIMPQVVGMIRQLIDQAFLLPREVG